MQMMRTTMEVDRLRRGHAKVKPSQAMRMTRSNPNPEMVEYFTKVPKPVMVAQPSEGLFNSMD